MPFSALAVRTLVPEDLSSAWCCWHLVPWLVYSVITTCNCSKKTFKIKVMFYFKVFLRSSSDVSSNWGWDVNRDEKVTPQNVYSHCIIFKKIALTALRYWNLVVEKICPFNSSLLKKHDFSCFQILVLIKNAFYNSQIITIILLLMIKIIFIQAQIFSVWEVMVLKQAVKKGQITKSTDVGILTCFAPK